MRHVNCADIPLSSEFQSTHPLRGATQQRGEPRQPAGHFNPRTPCGVRPSIQNHRISVTRFQSTHPLRGATHHKRHELPRCGNFNPRTPCGVRRRKFPQKASTCRFQSTHPLRGATIQSFSQPQRGPISIHAPLAGCDLFPQKLPNLFPISIHAPLAGCDIWIAGCFPRSSDFNPRTPCGVRRCVHCVFGRRNAFQSTHPLRGATRTLEPQLYVFDISIHAPLAGCDSRARKRCSRSSRFQSTHPLRGATIAGRRHDRHADISIHAPLAGCDDAAARAGRRHRNFNPRTPCGVRPPACQATRRRSRFQSTHPLRGAT